MQPDFAVAYREQVSRVYAFLAYRTLSAADAEDLTQLTFERALRAWSRYDRRRASVHTWLLAIARNVLADHYRRGPRSVEEPVADPSVEGSFDGGLERLLGLDPELDAALAALGAREREILALRFGADLTGPEIARLLDMTLANVQQVLSRTLRRLRAELEGSAPVSHRTAPAERRRLRTGLAAAQPLHRAAAEPLHRAAA